MALFKEAEVRRGIALLNERRPGWVGRINLDRLDMEYGTTCVLGQEFGSWYQGRQELGLGGSWNDDVVYGFNFPDRGEVPTWEEYEAIRDNYRLLTATWRILIQELRAPKISEQPVEAVRELVLV